MALSSSKKLSTLLSRKTSKTGDFYCLYCLHSFRTGSKFKSYQKISKSKDYCGIVMPTKRKRILEFYQYMKSDTIPDIIHADIKSLKRKKKWMCK